MSTRDVQPLANALLTPYYLELRVSTAKLSLLISIRMVVFLLES